MAICDFCGTRTAHLTCDFCASAFCQHCAVRREDGAPSCPESNCDCQMYNYDKAPHELFDRAF